MEKKVRLQVGDSAPDFSLPTGNGDSITLSSLQGKFVVLYFYPKDHTPGCTIEAKNFNKIQPKFTSLDAVIIGVSKDTIVSHEKFKKKCGLNFLLASDTDLCVCQQYGVWVEKSLFGKKHMGIQRTTYLIDKKGHIAFIWRKVAVLQHAEEVLSQMALTKILKLC